MLRRPPLATVLLCTLKFLLQFLERGGVLVREESSIKEKGGAQVEAALESCRLIYKLRPFVPVMQLNYLFFFKEVIKNTRGI